MAAGLLVLERLGVSRSVLWTALTGFMAVAAVAFFAAWSGKQPKPSPITDEHTHAASTG